MDDDAPPDDPPRPLGYVALVRTNRNFRKLWCGQIVSLLGDWFNLIATATLVEKLTGSGLAIGGLFAVRMLAPFLVGPLAGVAADRFSRRGILILSDVLRAVTVLGFLFVDEPSEVWILYSLTFVQLALSGFYFPANKALLPDLVRRENLGTANALTAATWSTMLAVGAALGGVVAAEFGLSAAFAIDSLTFIVSACFLFGISVPAKETAAIPSGRGAFGAYLDGLSYLKRHKDIAVVGLHKAANSVLIAAPFQVVQVSLAKNVFVIGEDGALGLGLIMGCVGIGTGLGPIVLRTITGDDMGRLRIALAFSYLLSAAGLLTIGHTDSFAVVLVGSVLRGIGGGTGWVFSTQLMLMLVPDHVRGRVFGTEFALLTLLGAIGALVGGWVLGLPGVGIDGMLSAMACVAVVPAALWTLWLLRARQSSEGDGASRDTIQ